TAGASAGQTIREALRDPGGARRVPAKAPRGPCVLLVQFTAMETFVHNAAPALERREVVTPACFGVAFLADLRRIPLRLTHNAVLLLLRGGDRRHPRGHEKRGKKSRDQQ